MTIPGIKHYGIHNEARERGQREAIAAFDEHLKGDGEGKKDREGERERARKAEREL